MPESLISAQVSIEIKNKKIEQQNKEIDNIISEKQNQIASIKLEEDKLKTEIAFLNEKVSVFEKFSKDLTGSKEGNLIFFTMLFFTIVSVSIIFYRFAYFRQLDDKNNFFLNPIVLFFELLILAPFLTFLCRLIGQSYYKGRREGLNSELTILINKRNVLYKSIYMIMNEIENLQSTKQKKQN